MKTGRKPKPSFVPAHAAKKHTMRSRYTFHVFLQYSVLRQVYEIIAHCAEIEVQTASLKYFLPLFLKSLNLQMSGHVLLSYRNFGFHDMNTDLALSKHTYLRFNTFKFHPFFN